MLLLLLVICISNVYFPCSGTSDRLFVYEELIEVLSYWMQVYCDYKVVIGGDFNTDLDIKNPASDTVNHFISESSLYRCDILSGISKCCTYFNDALQCQSTIDYFLTNDNCVSTKFDVLDPYINFSDHVPILISCVCVLRQSNCTPSKEFVGTSKMLVPQLRWDRADLGAYRLLTGSHFQSVLQDVINLERSNDVHADDVDSIYSRLLNILRLCSDTVVPACRKIFLNIGGTRKWMI